MNKTLTIFLFATIMLSTLVSATVYESVYVYKGTVSAEGQRIQTDVPVINVNAVGYTCKNSACSSAEKLWTQELSTGSDNIIVLSYPTESVSDYGYIVYLYKEGYFSYVYRVSGEGSGAAPDREAYLYKDYRGIANIDELTATQINIDEGESIDIHAEVFSPSISYNPSWFVPSEVQPYLRDSVKSTLTITKFVDGGETKVYEKIDNLYISWSSKKNLDYSWTGNYAGTYRVKLITEVTDSKFLYPEKDENYLFVHVNEIPTEPINETNSPIIKINNIHEGSTYPYNFIKSLDYGITDESELQSCQVSTNNGITKTPISCTSSYVSLTPKSGVNTWTLYAEDIYGNKAEKTVHFSVLPATQQEDTNSPVIKINNIHEGSTYPYNFIHSINYEITDESSLKICHFSSDYGTKYAIPCDSYTWLISPNTGTNTWTIYAEDFYGNKAEKTVHFSVLPYIDNNVPNDDPSSDTTAPSISIVSPQSIQYTQRNIVITITTNEYATVWFSLNSGTNTYMANPSGTTYTYTLQNLNNGQYNLNIYAQDASGNTALKTVSFSVNADDNNNNGGSGSSSKKKSSSTKKINDYASDEEQDYLNQFETGNLIYLEDSQDIAEEESQKIFPTIIIIITISAIVLIVLIGLFIKKIR